MYGKIINDKLEYAPSFYVAHNGRRIANFNKNVDIMKRYGYLEIEDIVPMYDQEKEFVDVVGYEIENNKIVVKYAILSKAYMEPSIEERVANIETVLGEQSAIFDEEINK